MENNSKNSLSSAIIVASILISLSVFYLAYTLQKGGLNLSSNKTIETANNNAPLNVPPAQQVPEAPKILDVSVDDDPFIGSKDAPITIIEFSDYECPFCKRFVDSTYPQLKENYVNKGVVKLYFRDLPLSFHDPMATKMALAANCVREQGQDAGYFKMHDEIFANTATNGVGITDEKLNTIVTKLGFNSDTFTKCVEDTSKTDEIKKDLADATKVGATGTPTFFIGKSTESGIIKGEMLVGAQPYNAFEEIIKKYQ